MRLFVALEIPEAVRDNLAALMKELRSLSQELQDRRPRWVRAENFHVTLKFIGEGAPDKLEEIREALAKVRSSGAAELEFHGLGFFPNEKHARVLWAGMECSPNLATLAADIDGALEPLGIARETRPFSPHLTLARFEPPGAHEKLRAAILQRGEMKFGAVRTREFHLIESKTRPAGAEYTPLAEFRFAAEG